MGLLRTQRDRLGRRRLNGESRARLASIAALRSVGVGLDDIAAVLGASAGAAREAELRRILMARQAELEAQLGRVETLLRDLRQGGLNQSDSPA